MSIASSIGVSIAGALSIIVSQISITTTTAFKDWEDWGMAIIIHNSLQHPTTNGSWVPACPSHLVQEHPNNVGSNP